MSDSLRPQTGLHHTRILCASLSLKVWSNSHPLSCWCYLTISSSVTPFSSCPQSFPTSGSFPMSQFFQSGGQSIEASASASVLLMNIQDWFPQLTALISLHPGDSKKSSPTPQFESSNSSVLSFLMVQLSHPYMAIGKTITLTIWTFVGKSNVSGF